MSLQCREECDAFRALAIVIARSAVPCFIALFWIVNVFFIKFLSLIFYFMFYLTPYRISCS